MSELAAEVCRAHVDGRCKACDQADDELWIHPRDLNTCSDCERRYAREDSFYDDEEAPRCPPCGDRREYAAECSLCELKINNRREDIAILRARIAENEAEIAAIERGDRHTEYHRQLT